MNIYNFFDLGHFCIQDWYEILFKLLLLRIFSNREVHVFKYENHVIMSQKILNLRSVCVRCFSQSTILNKESTSLQILFVCLNFDNDSFCLRSALIFYHDRSGLVISLA